ncbi:MAG: acyltransferase [Clostridia bacterium]|nr:acyltransferase [Clostridia bacterium]
MEVKKLFKYRNIWMAIAIIWIMYRHSGFFINNTIINAIKEIGYGGVDIFLFASGLGCYFSLSKNSNIETFIKKRFLKLMPTYWCFIVLWIVCEKIMGDISFNDIIGNIFAIQNFTGNGNDFNWYISALWLLYILAPYFMCLVKRIKKRKMFYIVELMLILFSLSFWKSNTLIITITRIPIFFMGMYIAKIAEENNEKITNKKFLLLMLEFLLGIMLLILAYHFFSQRLWEFGLYWYPFLLITPGLCLIISYISYSAEKTKIGVFLLRILGFIGNHTFEIYLVHILIFNIIRNLIQKQILHLDNNIIWLGAVLIVVIGCVALNFFTKLVLKCTIKIREYLAFKNKI